MSMCMAAYTTGNPRKCIQIMHTLIVEIDFGIVEVVENAQHYHIAAVVVGMEAYSSYSCSYSYVMVVHVADVVGTGVAVVEAEVC